MLKAASENSKRLIQWLEIGMNMLQLCSHAEVNAIMQG
jgi:hypothetical protein